MKVEIVITGVNISDSFNAGSIRVRNLLDSIACDHRYRVTNIIWHKNDSITENSVASNITLFKANGNHRLLNIYKLLWRLKNNGNQHILYNYGSVEVQNLVIILWAKFLGYKIIFDIVENHHVKVDFKRPISRLKFYFTKYFEKRLYWFADGCIVISGNLFEQMAGFLKNRIQLTHIPISVRINEWAGKSSPDNNKQIIYYGGSFGKKDGLNYLLYAFYRISDDFPHAELHMSGKGAKRHIEHTRKVIKSMPCRSRIRMIGSLDREEYVKKVFGSDIVCVTRTNSVYANFGFPFKLGEYLAAGKTIIVSDVSDVSKYLEHKRDAWIVKPESVRSIEEGLRELLTNKILRSELEKNAKLKAIEHFDSLMISKEFKNTIENLVRQTTNSV